MKISLACMNANLLLEDIFMWMALHYGGLSMTKFNNQELISNYSNSTCVNPKLNSNEPILCSKLWMHPTEAEGQKPVSSIMHIIKMQKGIVVNGTTQVVIKRKGRTFVLDIPPCILHSLVLTQSWKGPVPFSHSFFGGGGGGGGEEFKSLFPDPPLQEIWLGYIFFSVIYWLISVPSPHHPIPPSSISNAFPAGWCTCLLLIRDIMMLNNEIVLT